jgi:F-type H+-transporting ATPase subunit gamma
MIGTKEIKRRIRSVISIQQITRAMEMIAVSRLKKSEDRVRAARPYADKLREFMETLAPSLSSVRHPLLVKREVKRVGLVVITSDKGLCGGYNANVLSHAMRFLADHAGREVRLILVGRKASDFFRRKDFPIDYVLTSLSKEISLQEIRGISGAVVKGFTEGLYDEVDLLCTRYQSAVSMFPTLLKLLPLEREEASKGTGGIEGEPLFEPEPEEIMGRLLPRYLDAQLYHGLVESMASEQGARMVSMKSATENAEEMIASLTLTYNKARQAAITKELLEVTTGADALRYAREVKGAKG